MRRAEEYNFGFGDHVYVALHVLYAEQRALVVRLSLDDDDGTSSAISFDEMSELRDMNESGRARRFTVHQGKEDGVAALEISFSREPTAYEARLRQQRP